MAHNISLKQRLLVLTLVTVVTVWGVAAVVTYYDARIELNDVLDAHLAQAAVLLVAQSTHELDEIETEHAKSPHKYAPRIAFQVWEHGATLRIHSVNAPSQPLANLDNGFSDNVIDGQHWRVYSSWDPAGDYLIHVAERTEVRDQLAGTIARNLLQPMVISLPLLAILLWLAVARGLHPLVRLTAQIEQRDPENLAPLEAGEVPREVIPLIDRLNQLFSRIAYSMQNERRFTADAAHELRTPVAVIKAQAQVAQGASNREDRMHALENAILGCDRAAHLIDQLLTLSRVDSQDRGVSENCPLSRIAAEVIASLAPSGMDKGVQIELLVDEKLSVPDIRGNPALLRVLLRNLIDNSIKHTAAGTTVQVSITQDAENIILAVSDDGPGISEPDRQRVTERFYRPLGTQASGSGLGLSIVKRIADVHNATLLIEPTREESGLCVTVKFSR